MKPDILLCTFNSTYQHTAFGLRYLQANLGDLKERSLILETTIKDNPRTFVERILNYEPKIVGFGVYIWNTEETLEAIMILKKVAPLVRIVLGGPEISFETEGQRHLKWCDHVIKGEADFLFRELCETLLSGGSAEKIISGALPEVAKIRLPYSLYTDNDIKNRLIYVEVSRGCPYKCEYCLSSLDKSVRSFDLRLFLEQIETLLTRGVRDFKFVDRTFNLSPTTSTAILKFFLENVHLGLFLHFELVPDRLPPEIRELIAQFPAGSLQFEIGIQTLNPQVAANVSRKNDMVKVEQNFAFLREHTKVHTHADLIVGLPGETLESFAAGFDRLTLFGPDEIQVGILKRLKGTPIARHEGPFKMLYSEAPPFQILTTSTMDYVTLQKMNRFAKYWDLYANSGEFKGFMKWMRSSGQSLFSLFFEFVEYLSSQFAEAHSHSLMSLAEKAYHYMQIKNFAEAALTIENDFCKGATRRDLPAFLKSQQVAHQKTSVKNNRQLKHLN